MGSLPEGAYRQEGEQQGGGGEQPGDAAGGGAEGDGAVRVVAYGEGQYCRKA